MTETIGSMTQSSTNEHLAGCDIPDRHANALAVAANPSISHTCYRPPAVNWHTASTCQFSVDLSEVGKHADDLLRSHQASLDEPCDHFWLCLC